MVTVPTGLHIVSHGVDVSDVVSFILGQNFFKILVVLYILLGCFQFVLVLDRNATSTSFRNMLWLISSSVKASLDSSSPPTFWHMRRNVSGDFGCIVSPKVRFWIMYGFALCSNVWEDSICELIGGCEGDGCMIILLGFDWRFDVIA